VYCLDEAGAGGEVFADSAEPVAEFGPLTANLVDALLDDYAYVCDYATTMGKPVTLGVAFRALGAWQGVGKASQPRRGWTSSSPTVTKLAWTTTFLGAGCGDN
jgi:hypothetical protein